MAAPSTAPAKKAAPKAKKEKAPASNGDAPAAATDKADDEVAKTAGGRPDQAAYNAEQDKLKAAIDSATSKLNAVKEKISLTTKSGPGADRRTALREELDTIRSQQAGNKGDRSKQIEKLKAINETVANKVKTLQAQKTKAGFKSVADVDAHIKSLEKSVESGNLKLGDEKRALAEISTCKKTRRVIEGFEAEQAVIDAERAKADEIRKQLDDPESKAISDRFDAIKAELDTLKKESDDAYADRNKLFDERTALQAELDGYYSKKREGAAAYRAANDKFYAKLAEDRARRAEKARAAKAEEEATRKREIAERILEEAEVPAFQAQIEDCQTLIDHFSGKSTVSSSSGPLGGERAALAGVAKLELRKVEDAPAEGLVARKKKGEDEESYFVAAKRDKNKKPGSKATTPSVAAPSPTASPNPGSTNLHVPLHILTALLEMSIPPPGSTAEVPRTIEDLKTKKAWFEANSAQKTKENIAKAEAEIKRLEKAAAKGEKGKEADANGPTEEPEAKVDDAPEAVAVEATA
jgi:uncharacterized coiled-coil DUF342 family protein